MAAFFDLILRFYYIILAFQKYESNTVGKILFLSYQNQEHCNFNSGFDISKKKSSQDYLSY